MKPEASRLDRRIARHAAVANLILWLESILAAFWPAVTLLGAFLILALLGIPPMLPPVMHLLLLAGFAAGFAVLAVRGARRVAGPSPDAGLRRVERDSALAHRPFDALVDRPAGDATPLALQLWRLHLERRRATVGRLRLSPPNPNLPLRDPRALRLLVLIGLALGLVIAGPRAGHLLMASLSPSLSFSGERVPVEAWIKPPAYTGFAPIILKVGDESPVAAPTGSTL